MLKRNSPDYWSWFWDSFNEGLSFDPRLVLFYIYNQVELRERIYTKYRHIYGGALYD